MVGHDLPDGPEIVEVRVGAAAVHKEHSQARGDLAAAAGDG
jgi:hypothetical protein